MLSMVSLEEIRVCKLCGNVFSKKAGVTLITECPQCKGTSFEPVDIPQSELSQE